MGMDCRRSIGTRFAGSIRNTGHAGRSRLPGFAALCGLLLLASSPANAVLVYLANLTQGNQAVVALCDGGSQAFAGPGEVRECAVADPAAFWIGLPDGAPALLDLTEEGDFSVTIQTAAGTCIIHGTVEKTLVAVPAARRYYVYVHLVEAQ